VPHDDPRLAALGSLTDPVRRRLYEFVAAQAEPVGRDEAAAAAGIGRPLAAYHLDKLVELGLLSASYERRPGRRGPGAGRPAKRYARSAGEFTVSVPPREYELAARLLAAAVAADPGGTCHTALRAAAGQLGRDLARHHQGSGPGTDARHAIESVLRAHGFEPWLDPAGSVRLHNCPFHQLAAHHPALVCGMNLALITGMVAGVGPDVLQPVLDPQPGCCCVAVHSSQAKRGGHPCHEA
jgi:predicted ArsR family transcriptional regulator